MVDGYFGERICITKLLLTGKLLPYTQTLSASLRQSILSHIPRHNLPARASQTIERLM